MPLHITKVAVGCTSLDALMERITGRTRDGIVNVDTRYRPTRHSELVGGSLFWIVKHRLVARQEILGFGEDAGGRCLIRVDARLVTVMPQPRRAHQGWRYLGEKDAPPDLGNGGEVAALPPHLLRELAALALV